MQFLCHRDKRPDPVHPRGGSDISIAERYYRPASHAMKKLIRMVVEAAREGRIPVTICGSAVGNPANTLQYLQLGLRSFSVSPQNLIEVKKALMNAKIK